MLRLAFSFLLSLAVPAGLAAAQARAEPFVGQLSSGGIPDVKFSLDGNRLSAFSVPVGPTHCAAGAIGSDDSYTLEMPASAHVKISRGRFHYQGAALSAYALADQYGGRFTLSGTLNTHPTVVSGTLKLADAHDPFESGCSGSYRFLALHHLPDAIAPLNRASYQSKYIHFDYAAGVISNLEIETNFMCTGTVDVATVDAKTYGIPTLRTTASGHFRLEAYVLDSYNGVISLRFTGQIKGAKATGRIVIAEPPGFKDTFGDKCAGNYPWSAAKVPPPIVGLPRASTPLPL